MIKVVCVRDIKADVFGVPMFVAQIGGAIRSFGDECQKSDGNPFALHPEDYELYQLGEFDEATAKFIPLPEGPKQIAVGSNFKGSR